MGIILGWIGSICFAVCGIPQAAQCARQGHARGISMLFLVLWLIGEICYATAMCMEFGWVWWMMTNYIFNTICLLVIFRYRLWPRG